MKLASLCCVLFLAIATAADAPASFQGAGVASGLPARFAAPRRTYRIVFATTAEYTKQIAPGLPEAQAKQKVLAEIKALLERINQIYRAELAVEFRLVPEEFVLRLIRFDKATQPYTVTNHAALLQQNQAATVAVINEREFDIGHLLGTSGEGESKAPCICVDGTKAMGRTGVEDVRSAYFFAILIHEIGHQLGANHTFNGTRGACGRNRHDPTAYEPGSGSTIMAYSKNCMPQTVQKERDQYFHAISIEQITNNLQLNDMIFPGCPKGVNSGNQAPTITMAGPSTVRVPRNTPFELAVVGSDPDGDRLFYTFEQFDRGAPSPYGLDNDHDGVFRPMFRSRRLDTGRRAFPSVKNVVQGQYIFEYEAMPTTSRQLKFRIMARDRRGGFAHTDAVVNVDLAVDTFSVENPQPTAVWKKGRPQVVSWKGALKTQPFCPNVKISISTDGGTTFTTLVANTANTGSATVTAPNVKTKQAVIRIDGVGQVFFAASRLFTIKP